MSKKTENTYFQQFCEDYKVTPDINNIKLRTWHPDHGRHTYADTEIFSEDKQGNIDMLVYTLDRETIEYTPHGVNPEKESTKTKRTNVFKITRYKTPKKVTDPKTGEVSEAKYYIPKGAGTYPFFPPQLCDKYEKKEEIKTLVLTEGYKKAWYGALHGLDVVGLSSITHYKQKETQAMYTDVIRILKTCKVQNVVILYDADHDKLSESALKEKKDLKTRPASFYNSSMKINELLKDYDVDVYYAHIKSDHMEDEPKGLDDILISLKGEEKVFVDELLSFSDDQNAKQYSWKCNISTNAKALTQYLRLWEPKEFYDKYHEVIGDREFNHAGTVYQREDYEVDGEKQPKTTGYPFVFNLKIKISKDVYQYFRVGDTYYKKIEIPNKYNQVEKVFHKRMKSTIIDDHTNGNKNDIAQFIRNIPKYEAFCNVPNHIAFNQTPNRCYNLYAPFEHLPDDTDDCAATLDFLKHIFQEHNELGLDYIQILYQNPTQILPILCLVSKENSTGKSTFVKWLKAIFTQNCTVIGNDDLANAFNANWVSKLIIACEESFIEKKVIIEKIKALSTADKIQMNAKGKDQVEIDFFGKFILLSNNETNFIYASDDDIRYWVRKVPKPTTDKVNLLQELIDEIPAFLDFLNRRTLSTANESRMHFHPNLLKTDALTRLRETSKPKIQKELEGKLKEMFITYGLKELELPIGYIKETLLNNRFEESYIKEILKDRLNIDQYRSSSGRVSTKNVKIPDGFNINDDITWTEIGKTRPYVFNFSQFVNDEDIKTYEIPGLNTDSEPTQEDKPQGQPQQKSINFQTVNGTAMVPGNIIPGNDDNPPAMPPMPKKDNDNEDLPF